MAAPRLSPAAVADGAPALAPLRIEVDTHDRQQIEVEIAYPLQRAQEVVYRTDLYLFVARNVGVNHGNYGRDAFYNDLRAYLRLDSPPLTLSQLADLSGGDSPLRELDLALTVLERDPTYRPRRPIAALVRLFGHAFRESVRATSHALLAEIDQLKAARPPEGRSARLLPALEALGHDGSAALQQFRQLRRRFAPLGGARAPAVAVIFEHIDEYVSAYLVDQLANLAARLQREPALHDGSCVVAAALAVLSRHARGVAQARRLEGFAFPDPTQRRSQEFYTYRRGLIKKSLQQTFYLETRALRRDPLLRNAVAMVAAGLAAIWSLVAQAPTALSTFSARTQLWVLVVAVVAYMLKDRIKEVSRAYLLQRLWVYDHDTRIVGEGLQQLGLSGVTGRARERCAWLLPAQLPQAVQALRVHPRTVVGSDISSEEIIHYQRLLNLRDANGGESHRQGAAVRDILRLNLADFMERLDDPQEQVSYYDLGRERLLRVETPKVYHLNLLVLVTRGREREEQLLHFARHRVVLNQERIVRVEPVPGARPALSSPEITL